MSHRSLRALALIAVTLAGTLAAKPAFACHLATGWCCVETGPTYYCCYFSANKLQPGSCG
jgi:hypothetical protein